MSGSLDRRVAEGGPGLALSGRAAVLVARFALASLTVVLAGCSQARAVLPVPIETASLSLAQPQTFGSTEETARGIATILNQGFGLPLPRRVSEPAWPRFLWRR
ncbi:MAG TPA: hypothetical protein VLA89_01730 [Gemmatimonadales bacterium]|nr:hypothetical protein [Gemmatimonadales bacterium]